MFTEASQMFQHLPVFNHLGLENEWRAECILSTRIPEKPTGQPEDKSLLGGGQK
jgi:hypothetical protein